MLSWMPIADLEAWVNDPLTDDARCLDNNNEKPRLKQSDDQTWQQIIRVTGLTNSRDFQKLDKER